MISNGLFYLLLNILIYTAITFNINIKSNAQDVKKTEVATPAGVDLFYICRHNQNTRWLRIYKLDNGKCNTQYSKEGYLQIIGSATYYASCEGILHSVKKNLEEGGVVCSASSKYSIIEL